MFKTNLTNAFGDKMKGRAEAWASKPTLSYSIEIPEELKWVIYTEYGIDHSYTITGPKGVTFPGTRNPEVPIIHKDVVTHPPIAPTHVIQTVNASMMQNGTFQAAVTEAFSENDYQVVGVKSSIKSFVEKLKQEITDGIATALPGTRSDPQPGKLNGMHASDVFNELATIVEKE